MHRGILVLTLLAVAGGVSAQQIRSATGRGTERVIYTPRAAHNSMSKGTEPFQCEQYRTHPHPTMHSFCQNLEARTLTDEARRENKNPLRSVC